MPGEELSTVTVYHLECKHCKNIITGMAVLVYTGQLCDMCTSVYHV